MRQFAPVEFRILGALEVVEDGRDLTPVRGKQRVLLAMLILHANDVVAGDVLIEALWGESPPASAQNALQGHIAALRKLLGIGRIETRAPGYLLRLADDELDLARFEALVADAAAALSPDARAARLRSALGLWRGEPLADFRYEAFAQPEIARLEELRLKAVEARVEADLALGRHAEVLAELEALAPKYPLRERILGQLMIAFYRSGRQTEALAVYRELRRRLATELGIEPGPELRELERAILNQDPALVPPSSEVDQGPQPAAVPSVRTAPPVGREVRKTVTVLFADVTPIGGRLDPELLRRITGRAFEEMRHVLERHGGNVEQLIRGAVTAVFGIPVVHEDDALRAVRAASEIRERLAALNEDSGQEWDIGLALRTGISTGEVLVGGAPDGGVVGDAVRLAARLEQSARPDEIIMGSETHRFVRDAVVTEPAEQNGEESTFRLLAVIPGAPVYTSRFESPMVGRTRERRRLYDAFDQAVGDTSCQLFTILGTAGVGKSRLVQEFLNDLGGQALVARGGCLPYGEGITYWPLIEAVKEAAALDEADSPEQGRQKLTALLENEEDAELVARRVAELIGLSEATAGTAEGFWAVRTLFEALARRRPVVLVFEDIHWGEPTFLDLIEHIADWSRQVPLLLVCIARPELLDVRPGWGGGKLNATAVLLEPLSEDESSQLIDNLATTGLEAATRRRVIEAAEGNPLFVEEMLALALEDGRGNGELEVPPTIQALLAARLDRLADDERSVLEHASVEGKVFHQGSIVELSPETLRPGVATSLAALVRKELIRPERALFSGEHGFRFRHLLIRDAAYESLPKKAREELHERYAIWLEQKAGGHLVEYEEIVGYHLEQAFRYRSELGRVDGPARELARRAAEHLGAAGRRAFVRSDAPAAVSLISRAAALLPADDPARVDLIPNVRIVQGMSGDLSWADSILNEALETGDKRLRAHALVQRGFLRLFTEPEVAPDKLIGISEEAMGVFEGLGDDLGLARAWRLVAQAHYLARRGGPSSDASERAFAHARRAHDPLEQRESVEWLVIALFLGPAPATEAAHRCERLLEESAGDPALEAQILGTLAFLVAMQGRLDEAGELIARGRLIDEHGDWTWLYSAHSAFLSLWQDDPTAAELELRPSYEALKKTGEKSHFSTIAQLLAVAVYMQGHYREAEELVRECEEAARANDVHSQIMWRATRAKVLARRGEFEAAEALAREAVARAAESDFHLVHADALMDLGEVFDLANQRSAAGAAIKEAIRFYELKGNLLAASRARSLLEASAYG